MTKPKQPNNQKTKQPNNQHPESSYPVSYLVSHQQFDDQPKQLDNQTTKQPDN